MSLDVVSDVAGSLRMAVGYIVVQDKNQNMSVDHRARVVDACLIPTASAVYT